MSRFQFVADHASAFGVKRPCRVLAVSRSGFYRWRAAAPARAARAAADAQLAATIKKIHTGFDGTYGSPRVTAELRDLGQKVNHKRVERVMRTHRIVGVHLRKKVRSTAPEPSHQKVADLLKRDFTADAPNQRYVGDITYLPVAEGRSLYLATVIDLHSRRLAGWSIADHMRTELVADALRAAAATRGQDLARAIFHSDHGAPSTPPPTSLPSAPNSACASRWARSAPARTTPPPRRSTPPSNARPCKASRLVRQRLTRKTLVRRC